MSSVLNVVENNFHEVSVDARRMLFHIPTSGLFELDQVTGEVLDLLRQNRDLSALQIQQLSDHTPQAVDAVLRELLSVELVSDGRPLTPEIGVTHIDSYPLNTLILNVTTGCNLSCTYCYKEDLDKPSSSRRMTVETAKSSIEMLIKESPDEERYNLVFFGGEPLSNLALIRETVDYAEARFAELGKAVDFTMTTNATLLNEGTIDYLAAHRFGLSVSMDGPEAIHDRNRITVGGQGTYATVARKAKMLLERYRSRPVGSRVTLTRGITDVVGIWDHLFNDLGFAEVGFAPVTSGDISSFNLTEAELIEVFANMKKLGQHYLDEALQHRNIGFSNMHQLITDIHEGSKKALPCGAGVALLAVDHSGGLNLCHRFTGSDQPLYGTVETGIDREALSSFLDQRLDRSNTGCSDCRVRNLCSGGCYHESYARYEDASMPTYHYCDLIRDWIDFGIDVYTRIRTLNPDFIDTYITPRKANQALTDG